ncbi:hypothetical protein XELAEV_18034185mg [Xenopus laevis]|uniref:Ig-like domain-containing protein n=1 Tax=Xenopus laevis TaxID=8355 RepID=A0A974HAV9_XENLA|nr:hypothetical protein XELAEV_18034185mg [Xenopus laevis]
MSGSSPTHFSFCPAGLCQGVVVTQEKKLIVAHHGKSLAIPCQHDATDYLNMLWYQQRPGKELKLLAISAGKGDTTIENEFKGKWTMERPDVLNSTLNRDKVDGEDSAVYYCASSQHRDRRRSLSRHKTPIICSQSLQQEAPSNFLSLPRVLSWTKNNNDV